MDSESSKRNNWEITLQDRIGIPRKLSFQYLKEITNSFSVERVLGGGGFGVVYKGVLHNGELMAVKRLMSLMPGFQKQFENEVYHLMSLNHPNIVRCVGYCYETQNLCLEYNGKYIFAETAERLLCLEYMPKGSLDDHLTDESCGLDWRKRYNIISGICYGLHYLQEEWKVNTPIVHLDLKPANILLDDHMVPKIADFGLSRLFGEQQTRACTTNRVGTLGYMAPEYLHRGVITTKSDIFSLGVIIIEIITGHKNYPFDIGTSCRDFVKLVLKNWRNRLEAASCHTSLEIDYQQIGGCLEMGLSCLETDPIKRPTIREIIERINRWGNTDFHVGSDERSPTLPITSDPSEFLVINPRELHFCSELNKRSRCLVQLTNKTEEHVAFYFGVKRVTNNNCIEPNSAFLCPRSTFTVCVTMEEQRQLPSTLQCNDEFFVQTITARGNRLTSKHITDDSFNMSRNMVHKAKLMVVYVPPAQPTSLLRVGTEETKASDPGQSEGFSDQMNVDILIRCICQDLGFSNGRPFAAFIFYRCLLHWKSFEDGRTNVFDRIIASMFSAIKAPTIICQALFDHWQSIVTILSDYLHALKSNYVPSFLISKMFSQVFSFIDVQLFNSLLLSECCSLRDGEYIKAGLAKLEQWCTYETEEYAGSSWEELKHIRKAATLLTMREKQKKTLKEITRHLCPVLSIPQLYRICTLYRNDRYDTDDVSPVVHVLSSMESLLNKDVNNAADNNLLLDDDSASIPFTVDDILKSMTEFELADVDMPPLIRENPYFNFLRQ